MESLGQALKRVLQQAGIEKAVQQQTALEIWNQVVGDAVAEATEPIEVAHGCLVVKARNSTWRQELFFRKQDILEKLNSHLGSQLIKDIRFL
ncbi:MAG: DUF721 domain-containing protein [Candidatus Neomarinimicrobiota bacterium]|nr:MAG: DUF721 domain-containing protein [Candidatus Neomarinimicrobiota bacterium]